MFLTITLLVLTMLTGVGAWVYLRWDAAKSVGKKQAMTEAFQKKKLVNIKEIWEVEDVRRGVLILSNCQYRLICRMGAADFWLLSEVEQNASEDAAAAAMMQLTFPVQVLTTAQAADTSAAIEELRITAQELPDLLRQMALLRADYLAAMTQEKSASARQAYLVIPYDGADKGFDHAFGELHARLANLAAALNGANVQVEPLTTEAVVDLISHMLNRGRAWRPGPAVEIGVMSMYHVAEREVLGDA